MERNVVLTVTDINRYIKTLISQDPKLKYLYVKGEISNFKTADNGHLYFSLKDKECLINVAMFQNYASKLIFSPKNGDEVVVLASVDVYPMRGTYQLIAYEMNLVGQGDYLVELEKLKKQLQLEGLFDSSKKREINLFPKAIGVITAKNSAAIKDILTNLKRRYPIADIYVFYSSVQGNTAPKELLDAFNESQKYDLDTLIIGRGGGASEDLSAFNDETLVRAISKSKMPVIAAVGHEIDITLIDYVADKRASTPTGAAELATIDSRELLQKFSYCLEDMKKSIYDRISYLRDEIEDYSSRLNDSFDSLIENKQSNLQFVKEKLTALNPTSILNRGYSITLDETGKAIKNIKDIKQTSSIKTVLKDGIIYSNVTNVEADYGK